MAKKCNLELIDLNIPVSSKCSGRSRRDYTQTWRSMLAKIHDRFRFLGGLGKERSRPYLPRRLQVNSLGLPPFIFFI